MSTLSADDGVLAHLERLIMTLEERTTAQTTTLMALTEAGYDTRTAEETLWHSVDNLLALRRQQMHARVLLIEEAGGKRR